MAKRRRKKKYRLSVFGKAVAAFFVFIVLAVVVLTNLPNTKTDGVNVVIEGSGNPLERAASADATPVPTPTPTPVPSPTPTIRMIETPVPVNAVTPVPLVVARTPEPQESGKAIEARLNASGVNLRAGPSANDKVIKAGYSKNTRVKVYAREGNFYYVQIISDGQFGYVSAKFLPDLPAFTPVPVATRVPEGAVGGKIISNSLTLRKGPGTDYPSIGEYLKNQPLYIYFESNAWYYVEIPGEGTRGYLSRNYVEPEAAPPAGTPVP